jgi:hypothetical protein
MKQDCGKKRDEGTAKWEKRPSDTYPEQARVKITPAYHGRIASQAT